MAFTNNVMIVRHKLLAKLVNLWKENKLTNEIDRLPIELSPRRSRPLGRCCIHKERAVYKYKLFPLLGFDMTDETTSSLHFRNTHARRWNVKTNRKKIYSASSMKLVHLAYRLTMR